MPGLLGFFGGDAGTRAKARLAAMEQVLQPAPEEPLPSYRYEGFETPFAAAGLLHHGVLDVPRAEAGPISVLVDG